jgi:hypothetical protein
MIPRHRKPTELEMKIVLWGNLVLVVGWLAIFVMWGVAIWKLT